MEKGKSDTSHFLQSWHEGDSKALEALLRMHLPWIHAEVRRRMTSLLRKKGDTSDYVQDVIIKFLKHAPRFVISSSKDFRALLLKIVENTLHDRYDWYTARRRDAARERPIPSDTVLSLDPPREGAVKTPSVSAQRHEGAAWVRLGLEFLDPKDRELIILRQWDNLSYAEIGERLGVPADTARMRHNRAIERLERNVWNLRRGKLAWLIKESSSRS